MFKKRNRVAATRKKDSDAEGDSDDGPTEIFHATKQQKVGRKEVKQEHVKQTGGTSGGGTSSRAEKPEIFSVTSHDHGIGLERDKLSGRDMATRTFNVDADEEHDQRAINERNEAIRSKIKAGELDAKTVRERFF